MDIEDKTIEIFCCYARKDQALLIELKNHLSELKREKHIILWADIDINAGTEWEKEIHRHLNTAQVTLLLLSPDFMASDYCYSIEMQRALERHERGETNVISIILRPVYWKGKALGKLQALPTDGKPVTAWNNQDDAFYTIVLGIRNAVETRIAKEEQLRKAEEKRQQKAKQVGQARVAKEEQVREYEEEKTYQIKEKRQRKIEEQKSQSSQHIKATVLNQSSSSVVGSVPSDGQSHLGQVGSVGRLTLPSFQSKKYPNFRIIIGIIFLLVVLISVSAIFFLLRPNNQSGSGRNPTNSNRTPITIALPSNLITSGILTVGSDTTYPPQEFIDTASGKAIGFDVDLITAMAEQMGLKADVKTTNFNTIVDDLKAKRYDVVISAQTITSDRQKQVDFVPYFNAGQSILVANGNPKKINNVTDLCSKTVGVQDGTTELDTLNAENQAACKANPIKLTVLGAQTDVINLLVTGRVDATFQDSPVTDYYLKLNPGHFEVAGSIINAAPEGISIRKGDTSMFKAIQQAFNAVKSNGTYDRLFTKWQLNPTQKIT